MASETEVQTFNGLLDSRKRAQAIISFLTEFSPERDEVAVNNRIAKGLAGALLHVVSQMDQQCTALREARQPPAQVTLDDVLRSAGIAEPQLSPDERQAVADAIGNVEGFFGVTATAEDSLPEGSTGTGSELGEPGGEGDDSEAKPSPEGQDEEAEPTSADGLEPPAGMPGEDIYEPMLQFAAAGECSRDDIVDRFLAIEPAARVAVDALLAIGLLVSVESGAALAANSTVTVGQLDRLAAVARNLNTGRPALEGVEVG